MTKKKLQASRRSKAVAILVPFPATGAIDRSPPRWIKGEYATKVWQRLYILLPEESRASHFAFCFELTVQAMLAALQKKRVSALRALELRQCLLAMKIDPAHHRTAFNDLRLTKASAAALFGEPFHEFTGGKSEVDSKNAPPSFD